MLDLLLCRMQQFCIISNKNKNDKLSSMQKSLFFKADQMT